MKRTWIRVAPTALGIRFFLLLVAMGFAAVNTRNNLLYLMFSVGLAAVVVSMVSGWLSLRGMALRAVEPINFYAGATANEHIRIRNASRLFEGYAMEVEELDFPGGSPRAALTHLGRAARSSFVLEKIYPHRGVFETERMRIMTWFPFGLFRSAREIRLSRRLTVFPRVWPVNISFVFDERSGTVPLRQRRGESDELLRIRRYATGDNIRHIHWKATAKLGHLMIREFASEHRRRFTVVFDNTRPYPNQGGSSQDGFETSVSAAASLVSHLSSHEIAFRFVSADEVFPHGSSPANLRAVLSHLATVQLSSDPRNDIVGRASEALMEEDIVLVVPGRDVARWSSLSSPGLHLIDPEDLMPEERGDGS